MHDFSTLILPSIELDCSLADDSSKGWERANSSMSLFTLCSQCRMLVTGLRLRTLNVGRFLSAYSSISWKWLAVAWDATLESLLGLFGAGVALVVRA